MGADALRDIPKRATGTRHELDEVMIVFAMR